MGVTPSSFEVYMNYFFVKSKFLILFFTSVSVMITLTFSSFFHDLKRYSIHPDFLSDKCIKFTVYQTESPQAVVIKQIINELNNLSDKYILYKNFDGNFGKAVYFNNTNAFHPQIISGRTLTENDFKQGTNTAIIKSGQEELCSYREGNYFFTVNNNEYKVVGIYKDENEYINPDSMSYINLIYDSGDIFTGNFILDAYEKTDSIYKELSSFLKNINPEAEIHPVKTDTNTSDTIFQLLSQRGIIIFLMVLTLLLLILNTFHSTFNWITSRKKEIAVRRLVGANELNIKLLLLKDYIIIISYSYILGLILSIIINISNILPLFTGSIRLHEVIISYIFCLSIGIITGYLIITHSLKKSINKEIRGIR